MLTIIILVISIVLSVVCLENRTLFYKLCWNPHSIKTQRQYYRIITHGFIHVDIFHLIMNMYVLYVFGTFLEKEFELVFGGIGKFYFLLLYLGGMIFALPLSFRRHQDNYGYNSAGASGAIAAVIFSSILLEPVESQIGLIFIPVFIPAFLFGFIYLILEAVLDKMAKDTVAHDAHFMGAIFGFFFTGCLQPGLFMQFFAEVFAFFGI